MIKEVFEKEFHKVVDNLDSVIIDFYTDWCGPCKQLAPIFEEASNSIKNSKFLKVNLDKSQELAREYSIMSVPIILVLKKGKEVARINGFSGKERFIEEIKAAL